MIIIHSKFNIVNLSRIKVISSLRLFFVSLLLSCTSAWATNVSQLQQTEIKDQQASKQSQRQVNTLDDERLQLQFEVRKLLSEAQSLEQYNAYLTRLVDDQQTEVDSLHGQIEGVKETRRGMVPLMLSMLDNLDSFVQLDAPFLADERQQRVSQLKAMMDKADISEAEKFRRVLQSYQVESDYGSKMGYYQGELTLNGEKRTVNFFYLGRMVFVAQSLDSQSNWVWDRIQTTWVELEQGYGLGIQKAIRMAKKTEIPDLLALPLVSEVTQ